MFPFDELSLPGPSINRIKFHEFPENKRRAERMKNLVEASPSIFTHYKSNYFHMLSKINQKNVRKT